jgi:urease accessory protein
MTASGWRGELELHYRLDESTQRTVAQDRHQGPLRVLQPLYPEGPRVCHHVIVHPPGGVVGGDELRIDARLDAGSHALITTPGATRFYRSAGAIALQRSRLRLAAGARLEWLPLETIAYSGCRAESAVVAELAPGAEMIGWDLLALGLPAANQPFVDGWYGQRLELPGRWLERARIAASDSVLLDARVGWAGHRVLGTAWFACGGDLAPARRQDLLDAVRVAAAATPGSAGATSPHAGLVVLRVLAPGVEPALQLLAATRAAWRAAAWGLAAESPRIWRT